MLSILFNSTFLLRSFSITFNHFQTMFTMMLSALTNHYLHTNSVQITCTLPLPSQQPSYFQSILQHTEQVYELVMIGTSKNELFMPFIDNLMRRKGRAVFILSEGTHKEREYFVRTYVKGNYHILQR